MVLNLTFSYSGRDFAPPVPVLWSIHSRRLEREVAVKTEDKVLLSTSAFSLPIISSFPVLFIELIQVFDLPFHADVPVEALFLILCILCQVQLQLHLGLPDPIPTQPSSVPLLVPGYLSLLPLPVHFLLALYFDQQVSTQP